MELEIIARMRSDFPTKFGLPRQSGLVEELRGLVVFEPDYADRRALIGIEGFSHLWLVWGFSAVQQEGWSPMVHPPRLGGDVRMGVFATRSPFRPNHLGLSCVRLLGVTECDGRSALSVAGADLMNGTPIYDIKPYLPYTDSRPDAVGGFAEAVREDRLFAEIPEPWLSMIPEDRREALRGVLRGDPRPAYQDDSDRVYGFYFCGLDVRFRVRGDRLTVCEVVPADPPAGEN